MLIFFIFRIRKFKKKIDPEVFYQSKIDPDVVPIRIRQGLNSVYHLTNELPMKWSRMGINQLYVHGDPRLILWHLLIMHLRCIFVNSGKDII